MKLTTPVEIPDYPFRLDHHGKILMLGSCFTDNIGRMLERYRFPVEINPFGTIFNPLSVQRSLEALITRESYREEDLEKYGDLWLSFDHYTGFSAEDPGYCLEKINGRFLPAKEMFSKASFLFLSWGTAWVYHKADSGEPVSNCHKIPAKFFTRSMLSPVEISDNYSALLKKVFAMNPDLKVLLTVSPIRHLKDGAHGNQLSKATLLLATEQLVREFPEQVFYFPSYEIVMDELRDYRFYGPDMVHLDETAIACIWEKFSASLLGKESIQIIGDLEPMLRLREHKPGSGGGSAVEKMKIKMNKLEEDMGARYPFLDL